MEMRFNLRARPTPASPAIHAEGHLAQASQNRAGQGSWAQAGHLTRAHISKQVVQAPDAPGFSLEAPRAVRTAASARLAATLPPPMTRRLNGVAALTADGDWSAWPGSEVAVEAEAQVKGAGAAQAQRH